MVMVFDALVDRKKTLPGEKARTVAHSYSATKIKSGNKCTIQVNSWKVGQRFFQQFVLKHVKGVAAIGQSLRVSLFSITVN